MMTPMLNAFTDELVKLGAVAPAATHLTPASSNVKGFRYDPKTKSLFVTFKGGSTYSYAGVPPKVFKALRRNKSAGKTVNRLVKNPGYAYAKVASRLRAAFRLVPKVSKRSPRGKPSITWDAFIGNKRAGEMFTDGNKVNWAYIYPEFQGMGLGKKMYGEVMRRMPKQTLRSDRVVTADARRIWDGMESRGYGMKKPLAGRIVLKREHGAKLTAGTQYRGRLPKASAAPLVQKQASAGDPHLNGVKEAMVRMLRKRANDPVKEVVKVHEIPVALEWRKGETRKYFNHDPLKQRSVGSIDYDQKMKADYGYVKGVIDADGEELDVYLGPNRESEKVFVLEKMRRTDNTFDENKVMLGYDSMAEAKKSYLQHQGKDEMGKVTEMTVPAFKAKFLRKNKFKKHGAAAISFPDSEHASLQKRLARGAPIYTTRVDAELGQYQKGQKLTSDIGERLRVASVRRLSGLDQHPFLGELTAGQKKELAPYDKLDLVKLTKTANGDMLDYFNKHPKKRREYLERRAAKKKLKAKKRRNRDGFKHDARAKTAAPNVIQGMLDKKRQIAKIAGVAKKQVTFDGLTMKLEYLPGDIRSGTHKATGKQWSRKMHASYGYVPGTYGKGADGDAIDVYLAKEPVPGSRVYRLRQMKKEGGFDEDKYMVGFPSGPDAKKAFLQHMPSWAFGNMTGLSMRSFSTRMGQAKKLDKAAEDNRSTALGALAGGAAGGGIGHPAGKARGARGVARATAAQKAGLASIMGDALDKALTEAAWTPQDRPSSNWTRWSLPSHGGSGEAFRPVPKKIDVAKLLQAGGAERKALETATDAAVHRGKLLRAGGAVGGTMAGGVLGALLLKKLLASKEN